MQIGRLGRKSRRHPVFVVLLRVGTGSLALAQTYQVTDLDVIDPLGGGGGQHISHPAGIKTAGYVTGYSDSGRSTPKIGGVECKR